ncbi:MAG: GNAT family N-acetyltransferase [Dactylosporangium sp.]|nr:GNAT family N-acetyltransferase [Dactylosporangium sp.]NNJ62703.1 GNAT family N-acetyltransferase [Dactylosporangium sp.]
MASPPTVERAAPEEARALAQIIGDAFAFLPVTGWLVPAEAQRAGILGEYFNIIVEHAVVHGVVETVADRSAVAVWHPAASTPMPEIADYDQRMATVCGPNAERFGALDDVMHASHPPAPPVYDYLALLAVRPGRQGTGLGTALLRHRHQHLDRPGVPAYVEASSLGSRRLYQRHGYQDRGEPFAPPGCEAVMWPMWREPNP